jgi:cytochrome P450
VRDLRSHASDVSDGPLATLELVVAVQTLLAMTARVELAADAEPVRETYPLGGWRRVPVRLR